jgi:hypothetical protein
MVAQNHQRIHKEVETVIENSASNRLSNEGLKRAATEAHNKANSVGPGL